MRDSPQLLRVLVQKLECLHRSGVRSFPKPPDGIPQQAHPETASQVAKPEITRRPTASEEIPVTSPVAAPAPTPQFVPPEERDAALQVLAEEVAQCTKCAELVRSRKQTVFGVGNANARLVFFGEAPGADEDRQGEPFVGKAGQLLTKIIEACRMQRDDVYIMNVLKCRPPGNRNPSPEEAMNCRSYFERQFDIIRPEYICCLGSIPARTLLETNESIGRLRGRFHDWRGIPVVATYHPAYLLRNPAAKKLVWADMKMLMKEMGVDL